MKVNGTGSALPPVDAEAAEQAGQADASQSAAQAQGTSATVEGGPHTAFAASSQNARAPEMAHLVADVNADFKAGKITAEAAVDRIVERVLDRQVGAAAPAALRAQVEAALRQTLTTDPFVGAQVSALRRKQG